MAEWEQELESLSRKLAVRAAQATRQLSGRAGVPGPDDLAQEVITRLFTTYGERELRSWTARRVYGVAARALHNLVVDLTRRKVLEVAEEPGPSGETPRDALPSAAPDPEQVAAERQLLGIFTGCFESVLKDEERRFVALSFELDSAPAAQKELGWPPGTVDKSKVCHLRRRLLQRVMRCVQRKTAGHKGTPNRR